jgi:hypothetical protein
MTDNRVDKTLTHEILVALRNSMADLRRDIRDLKASNATILGLLGELVKALAWKTNGLSASKLG